MILQLLSTATAALALSTASQTPPNETAPAAEAAATADATVAADLSPGMPVKDKTGAVIGTVAEVKPSADGKRTATIQMGADVFAVDAASLAVDAGAANLNATHSELIAMLKARK